MNEDGYCAYVYVDEPDQKFSMVLDHNGRPFMYEPRREPIGFLLTKRENNEKCMVNIGHTLRS